ncbi:LysR family transcriptional regulator [Falsihalocynthiibacter sp. SS001]|uniref:LysR family transcriptional regulator n=1 Tax=Falsihalocynthiibacter sp. SS001 TaxID=3349698 RepID=UPI0036D3B2F6
MKWDDLRIFLAVARAESISGAGKAMRIDAATVGRRIARLEQELETPLFAKSPQGYALTDAGLRLVDHAAQAEQAVGQAVADLRGAAQGLSGVIRIGAPDGCANYLLPQICAEICRDHPGLDVQIVALPRVFNLSKREADMAITVSPPNAGRLTVQKLSDYHLHLAGSEAYLAQHPPLRSVEDLKGHRMIGYIPDMIFDKELDYLAEVGAERVTLGSNSVSVQFNWVRTGGGLGVVHDFAIPSAPHVKRILTNEISLTRSFYLVRHIDDRRVERLNQFAELLAQGVRREIAHLEAQT